MNIIKNIDCRTGLADTEDNSVHCCITSPPYFQLRDYGVENQIGNENTVEQYVACLVDVFREVRRVLRDDGTLWLNLGDSYAGQGGGGNDLHGLHANRRVKWRAGANRADGVINQTNPGQRNRNGAGAVPGYKTKDLIGIPWEVALALRRDGWYLRQDIIWHKPNPMPESAKDRCTKAHEYIFLFSKNECYYFDGKAISEPAVKIENTVGQSGLRNKRSVWTVPLQPFKGAHFATFPEDLIAPCILAGCPVGGIVLDPFMGAGTTALVAAKLDRQYLGFELNTDYCKIAEKRLLDQLGMFKP